MNKKIDPQLLIFAKSMRHTATDAEHLMWQILRAKRFMNLKFRSQHGMDDAIEYDAERTKFLEALGLTVVRYWNYDVLGRTVVVLEDLWRVCFELKSKSTSP